MMNELFFYEESNTTEADLREIFSECFKVECLKMKVKRRWTVRSRLGHVNLAVARHK